MYVLYETSSGYGLFKVKDDLVAGGAKDGEAIVERFRTSPSSVVQLVEFEAFRDSTEATAAATAIVEGKVDRSLEKFLKHAMGGKSGSSSKKQQQHSLLVSDSRLGAEIKRKLNIECEAIGSTAGDDAKLELIRGIRGNLSALVPGLAPEDVKTTSLGLAHSLSRYKLRFSPDRVDTMVVQAIGLLDELDKEINTYSMRVREWYGWHFPEMAKIVTDGIQYCKVARKAGDRTNIPALDFSDVIEEEEVEKALKQAANHSMGTEISEDDRARIAELCEQVVSMAAYRQQLSDYLRNRMNAIAPNLTVMVGELVGARLIAHVGSLLHLAKAPASTLQILGAEKALFRALKTKHDTPKYGLIYHASLIGQASTKNKGKIARVLAAKTSLAVRVDALGEDGDREPLVGIECREKVETRLRQLEAGGVGVGGKNNNNNNRKTNGGKSAGTVKAPVRSYNDANDAVGVVGQASTSSSKKRKRDAEEEVEKAEEDDDDAKRAKSSKSESSRNERMETSVRDDDEEDKKDKKKKKKKKKHHREEENGADDDDDEEEA